MMDNSFAQLSFPHTMPNETLFSRFVRHLTMFGDNEKNYLKYLFNHPRTSIHPYITIGIRQVAKLSNTDEKVIFKEQTLGRFFAYFLPPYAKRIYAALIASDSAKAHRACQLSNVKESQKLYLKFCPACAFHDIHHFGFSYWHLNHQLPGIESCCHHPAMLVQRSLPARPHLEAGLLPQANSPIAQSPDLSFELAQFASRIAQTISQTDTYFRINFLLNQLYQAGYITASRQVKRKKLSRDYYTFLDQIGLTNKSFLPASKNDIRYLSYLLKAGNTQHPMKYVLLMFWLKNLHDKKQPMNRAHFKSTSFYSGSAQSKSDVQLQISNSDQGKRQNTRPFKLTEKVKQKIIAMAYKGFHRRAIAKQFDVSCGSVEQIISIDRELVARRKRIKFESMRRKYKVQIYRTMQRFPDAIKTEIRKACNKAFSWLYLHERDWLNQTLPKPMKPSPTAKVDWYERDLRVAPVVCLIMIQFKGKISRTKLEQYLGVHGWLTKFKKKMPASTSIYTQMSRL